MTTIPTAALFAALRPAATEILGATEMPRGAIAVLCPVGDGHDAVSALVPRPNATPETVELGAAAAARLSHALDEWFPGATRVLLVFAGNDTVPQDPLVGWFPAAGHTCVVATPDTGDSFDVAFHPERKSRSCTRVTVPRGTSMSVEANATVASSRLLVTPETTGPRARGATSFACVAMFDPDGPVPAYAPVPDAALLGWAMHRAISGATASVPVFDDHTLTSYHLFCAVPLTRCTERPRPSTHGAFLVDGLVAAAREAVYHAMASAVVTGKRDRCADWYTILAKHAAPAACTAATEARDPPGLRRVFDEFVATHSADVSMHEPCVVYCACCGSMPYALHGDEPWRAGKRYQLRVVCGVSDAIVREALEVELTAHCMSASGTDAAHNAVRDAAKEAEVDYQGLYDAITARVARVRACMTTTAFALSHRHITASGARGALALRVEHHGGGGGKATIAPTDMGGVKSAIESMAGTSLTGLRLRERAQPDGTICYVFHRRTGENRPAGLPVCSVHSSVCLETGRVQADAVAPRYAFDGPDDEHENGAIAHAMAFVVIFVYEGTTSNAPAVAAQATAAYTGITEARALGPVPS